MSFGGLQKSFDQGLKSNSFKEFYKLLPKAKKEQRINFGQWAIKEMTKRENVSDKQCTLIFKAINDSLETMEKRQEAVLSVIKSIDPSRCPSSRLSNIFRCIKNLEVSVDSSSGSEVCSYLKKAIGKMSPNEAYFFIKSNHFEKVLSGTGILKTTREKAKDAKYIDYAIEINEKRLLFFEFIKEKRIVKKDCRKILPFLTYDNFRGLPPLELSDKKLY